MNTFDLVVGLLLVWSLYNGFKKGIVSQVASLFALLLGIFVAIKFSWYTGDLLTEKLDLQTEYLPLISFLVTFIAVVIGIHFVAKVVDKILSAIALGLVNKIFGAVFGLLKAALIVSVIISVLENFDNKYHFIPQDKIEDSILYEPLSEFAPRIFEKLDFRQMKTDLEDSIDMDINV